MSSSFDPNERTRPSRDGSPQERASTTEATKDTTAGSPPGERSSAGRRDVVAHQKEVHGGIKWGSAFFGFLTATGVGVLLTAVASAAGAAVGVATDPSRAQATQSASTIGLVSGIVLLVVLFVAYFCGGYVASRMARFEGVKQGIAVWVWALVIALVVAGVSAVLGTRYNVLSQLNSFPRIPVSEGDLTTGGIVAALLLVAVTLLGAIVGGLAGMRFHRKVDKTGLGN